MEDKTLICDALMQTLRLTRNHRNLVELRYEKLSDSEERVTAIWDKGGFKVINVSLDSGSAMIRDIMRQID